MTEDGLPLAELLAEAGDSDFLRSVAEAVLQMLMEADVEGLIGAGRHERTGERLNYRNGLPPFGRCLKAPRPHARHAARRPAAAHPEAPAGQLLPALPGAQEDLREGPGGRAVIREAWTAGSRRAGWTTWCKPWA